MNINRSFCFGSTRRRLILMASKDAPVIKYAGLLCHLPKTNARSRIIIDRFKTRQLGQTSYLLASSRFFYAFCLLWTFFFLEYLGSKNEKRSGRAETSREWAASYRIEYFSTTTRVYSWYTPMAHYVLRRQALSSNSTCHVFRNQISSRYCHVNPVA